MDISINSEICKFAVKVKVKKKEASDFMESGPGNSMPVLEEVEGWRVKTTEVSVKILAFGKSPRIFLHLENGR